MLSQWLDKTKCDPLLLTLIDEVSIFPRLLGHSMESLSNMQFRSPQYLHFLSSQKDTAFDNQGLLGLSFRCPNNKSWNKLSVSSGCGKIRTQKCQAGERICGLQTRLMPFQDSLGDDQGVMDVKFHCCKQVKGILGAFLL